jgi:hypothetical protein
MNDDDIFSKTSNGLAELRSRSAGLSQRLRSILIMVDGVRRVGDLRQAAATLGAPPDVLESLQALGLIALTAPAGAPQAQTTAARVSVAPPGAAASPRAATPAPATLAEASEPLPSSEADRFRVAKKFMNDTVVDALGIRAFMFTLKLEKCALLGDLEALLPEYSRVLTKARGSEVAGALETRLRQMLR